MPKPHGHSTNEMDVCADCNQTSPSWASINHGALICDQCAIIHRSLGRFVSQVKPIKSNGWKMTQLQMVYDLYRSGSNSIWEHTLLDPLSSSGSAASVHAKSSFGSYPKKKPHPGDPLQPNKNDFIRAKYQMYAYVNKSHGMKDDVESESDISEQLHSSVRTPNLKTSLRLLVAGANPNYIHSEKFNSPLHMAARSGQMSQIELLLIYGANLALVDSRGKSAIDYAREAGHSEIVYRLIEHQFELPDALTRFICQGRQPNHHNNSSNENEGHRNSKEVFRNDLHQSIRSLSHKSFQELARDVYDEIDRREINSFVSNYYANENGKLSILHQQLITPFLPVYQYFSTTRNQGRQKLALLNTKELTLLIVDVLNEVRRRVFCMNSSYNLKNDDGHGMRMINEFEDDDSEPLYDSVPSEEDYDECNEIIIKHNISKNIPNTVSQPSTTAAESSAAKNDDEDSKKEKHFVSMIEYVSLKEQMLKSTDLMEAFLNENKVMRTEIAKLQSVVDKLVEENAQLRQFIVPSNPLTSIRHSESKSSSLMLESTERIGNHNSQTNNCNQIRPQSMSNHSFSNEFFTAKSPISSMNPPPPPSLSVSPSKSSNSSIVNYLPVPPPPSSQAASSQKNASPQFNLLFNVNCDSFLNSPNSSSSSLSSQNPSVSFFQQKMPGNDINSQMLIPASTTTHLAKSASKSSLPTKDEVIKKIEYITNGIKELLLKAKEGKHDEFQHCSERICNYVSDMINLFPESIGSSKIDNLLPLNQALIVLRTNVLQLNEECHSYENVPRFQHVSTNQDNRYIYNTVIDKAAEVATSVKSIINLYTIQTTANVSDRSS